MSDAQVQDANSGAKRAAPTFVRDSATPGVAVYSHVVGGKNPAVQGRTFQFPHASPEECRAANITCAAALARFLDSSEGREFIVAKKSEAETISGADYVDDCANTQVRTYCRNRAAGVGRVDATGERSLMRTIKRAGTKNEKAAAARALMEKMGLTVDDLIG